MPWMDAWPLVAGLLRDPDSHLYAAAAGWSFAPGGAARAMADFFEVWVNAKQGKGKVPYRHERPWEKTRAESASLGAVREITDEDKKQREKLDTWLFGERGQQSD